MIHGYSVNCGTCECIPMTGLFPSLASFPVCNIGWPTICCDLTRQGCSSFDTSPTVQTGLHHFICWTVLVSNITLCRLLQLLMSPPLQHAEVGCDTHTNTYCLICDRNIYYQNTLMMLQVLMPLPLHDCIYLMLLQDLLLLPLPPYCVC